MTCRRRNGIALVAALAATFAVVATFAPAASAGGPLQSILSSTCLEGRPSIPLVDSFMGIPVYTANCGPDTGDGPQFWILSNAGLAPIRGKQGQFNTYHLVGWFGCLSNGGRLGDGAVINMQGSCGTSSWNKWALGRSGPNGSVELVNANSGKCLDVQGGFLGPNIRMIQWPCAPGTPFAGSLFILP
jgi:Ricin-type beta-trefoil lectin domain-like